MAAPFFKKKPIIVALILFILTLNFVIAQSDESSSSSDSSSSSSESSDSSSESESQNSFAEDVVDTVVETTEDITETVVDTIVEIINNESVTEVENENSVPEEVPTEEVSGEGEVPSDVPVTDTEQIPGEVAGETTEVVDGEIPAEEVPPTEGESVPVPDPTPTEVLPEDLIKKIEEPAPEQEERLIEVIEEYIEEYVEEIAELYEVPLEALMTPPMPVLKERIFDKTDIVDPDASHSCHVTDFVFDITHASAIYIQATLNNPNQYNTLLEVGSLPKGVDVTFVDTKGYSLSSREAERVVDIKITKEEGAQDGSFSVPLFYSQDDSVSMCQFNVVNI